MSSTGGLLAGRRILIVEDRYLIAAGLETDVQGLGGTVVGPARDIEAARDILASGQVDLALLDVNLDGDMVFPIAELLAGTGTPFAFVTGYEDWEWPPAWAQWPRICKPVNASKLETQLSSLIGAD